MPAEVAPTGRRPRISATRLTLEAWYVGIVTAVAAYGMAAQSHRPVLVLAAALALPFGVLALIGLYVLTGVFNSLANGFSNSSVTYSTGGCDVHGHCWSRTWGSPVGARGFVFCASVVLLFTAAALGNVLVLRQLQRDHRAAVPPPWPAPPIPPGPSD